MIEIDGDTLTQIIIKDNVMKKNSIPESWSNLDSHIKLTGNFLFTHNQIFSNHLNSWKYNPHKSIISLGSTTHGNLTFSNNNIFGNSGSSKSSTIKILSDKVFLTHNKLVNPMFGYEVSIGFSTEISEPVDIRWNFWGYDDVQRSGLRILDFRDQGSRQMGKYVPIEEKSEIQNECWYCSSPRSQCVKDGPEGLFWCNCSTGYYPSFQCDKFDCFDNCNHYGECVAPNICNCYSEKHYGQFCQFYNSSTSSTDEENDYNNNGLSLWLFVPIFVVVFLVVGGFIIFSVAIIVLALKSVAARRKRERDRRNQSSNSFVELNDEMELQEMALEEEDSEENVPVENLDETENQTSQNVSENLKEFTGTEPIDYNSQIQ